MTAPHISSSSPWLSRGPPCFNSAFSAFSVVMLPRRGSARYLAVMKVYAQTLELRPDPERIAEYVRRHERVWPEVLRGLRAIGIHQMRIFLHANRLFMTIETDDDFDPARDYQRDARISLHHRPDPPPHDARAQRHPRRRPRRARVGPQSDLAIEETRPRQHNQRRTRRPPRRHARVLDRHDRPRRRRRRLPPVHLSRPRRCRPSARLSQGSPGSRRRRDPRHVAQ